MRMHCYSAGSIRLRYFGGMGKMFRKGVSGENRWFGFGKRLGWALMERNGLELWCLDGLLDGLH